MPFAKLPDRAMDAAAACALLSAAGFPVHPDAVRMEARDVRWAVWLPGERMGWFPMNPAGARRLAIERRVLGQLATRCSFRVPRVLHADEAGWQVRDMVPGLCEPWVLYRRLRADQALTRRIGRVLGEVLAEQHSRVSARDVAGWLPTRPPWPEPAERLDAALRRVVADTGLRRAVGRALQRYEVEVVESATDRVLVHGDLGLHNIALLPGTNEVAGVFDYDGASWADRHQDFRYLLFNDDPGEPMLVAALEAYEPALGVRLDRGRIHLCNAACAIGFWELVHAVRLAALGAAAEHGVPLVVATFCYSEPEDRPLFKQFEAVMARHGGEVFPVFLHCSEEEARRRVGNADRLERRKIASAKGLAEFATRWSMAPVPRANCLVLDTEAEPPDAVAQRIVRHFALNRTGGATSSPDAADHGVI